MTDLEAPSSPPFSRPSVVAIIAAYNEEDVIAQVIADLIAQDVSVFLLDHRSTDRTVAEASPFLGRGLLHIERFPDDSGFPSEDGDRFAWRSIVARKAELACSLPFDWVIHADADELRESPWRDVSLSEGIGIVDRMGYNAIDFSVFQFRPMDTPFLPGDDLRQVFTHYEPGAPFDSVQIKCWKRTTPIDLASTAGHQVQFEGRRVFPIRFVLRHYPIRSEAHGRRKVFQERRPRFLECEREIGWHVQYDDVTEQTSFTRSASELIRWDPDVVRANLAIHHRGVEELSRALDAAEPSRSTEQR